MCICNHVIKNIHSYGDADYDFVPLLAPRDHFINTKLRMQHVFTFAIKEIGHTSYLTSRYTHLFVNFSKNTVYCVYMH